MLDLLSKVRDTGADRVDALALEVLGRLNSVNCLVAEEAVYHAACHRSYFRQPSSGNRGPPIDVAKDATFNKVCEWMEVNDTKLLTLEDVTNKAMEFAKDDASIYSEKWLKKKLLERYGDHIQFNEVRGRRNVICWKEMASFIINDKWLEERKGKDAENIVIAAAKLLKSVIREASYNTETYPLSADFRNTTAAKDWMPSLLYLFLDHLICPELKKVALGHSIVQAVRPKTVIAPIPFALGVSVDHVSGSKFLMNLLHRLGLSVSYDEVNRFKQSVTVADELHLPMFDPSCFTQYAADNVDHDVRSLDGYGTLHCMGIMSMASFGNETAEHDKPVDVAVKRSKRMTACEIAKSKRIPVLQCKLPTDVMDSIKFNEDCSHLKPYTAPPALNTDLLLHKALFLKSPDNLRPSWAGFNYSIFNARVPPATDIYLLPIIDLNPNDISCIYSTLVLISNQSRQQRIDTACVTFDQPLWLKAVTIVNHYKLNIVCRLGTFLTQMSFLGSLGSLMAASGLTELLQCCYGPNTVKHMLSGKTVARATRGHFLVESALMTLLLRKILASQFSDSDLKILSDFYDSLINNGYNSESQEFPDILHKLEKLLIDFTNELECSSRTAKLWQQYLRYVSVLKQLIWAERMGDWHLHLASMSSMINLFAATGHRYYAKCSRLYVEMMNALPEKHPLLYDEFLSGNHVARRARKLWAGISTDLAIKQCMMRALKSKGGLTNGRGVTESVRTTWIASVHETASVQTALANLTGLEYCREDMQHPELGKACATRE